MQRIHALKPRLVAPKSFLGFRGFSFSASAVTSKLTEDHEHFFRYTSGRWLCNEEAELAQRYLKFDVENLKRVAGFTQQSRCIGIRKLQEGFHNKVFLMQFENGSEAIARLPSPMAGHPHWTVANEVATLEFVRDVLGIPAPKVLGWSNQEIGQSGVGAEFMLMEHAPGRRLSTVWPSMEVEQRFAIVKGLIDLEEKLAANALREFGSIYLAHDCPEDLVAKHRLSSIIREGSDKTARFTIGQVPDKAFWPDEAKNLKVDRGPWDTPLAYFTAIAKREIALLQISKHNIKHIELLQKFLAILPFILPADKEVSRPTLWHLDIHEDNVFVDDTDPTKITSIIDWQNSWAAPLFMQARFPSLLDCPHPYSMGLVVPTLPEDFDTLLDEEKKQIVQEIKLKKYYEIGTRRFNPIAYKAMATMEDDNNPSATILRIISQTRKDGPVPLRELLIQIYEDWEAIVVKTGITSACPISFIQDEINIARDSAEAWAVAHQDFESLRSDLLGKDGWVSHEEYDLAKTRYEAHKHKLNRLEKKKENIAFNIDQAS